MSTSSVRSHGNSTARIISEWPLTPSPPPRAPSPVLLLLVQLGHDVEQAADERVTSSAVGGAVAGGLSGQHGAAPLCVR